MRVHGSVIGGAFLSSPPGCRNESAAGGIRIRQPHAERLHAVRQRRCEHIAAVDEFQSRNLTVGEASVSGRIGWIWIDAVRASLCGPRMPAAWSLFDVKGCPASD